MFKKTQRDAGFYGFYAFFGLVLIMILTVWGIVGYGFYRTYTCPECAGQMVGSFYKGVIDSSGVKELLPAK